MVRRANTYISGNAPFLDETPDHTQRIVKTSLALFQDQTVATRSENADRPPSVLDTSDPDNLGARVARLVDQICIPKLVLCESLDVCNRLAPKTLAQELNLVTLDVLNHKDVQLLEEAESSLVDSISENRLLEQKDVAVGLLDLFEDVEQVLTTFLDDFVHLSVIVDNDGVVHLNFVQKRLRQSESTLTSGLGALSWNWMRPIFAFSILVGPPAATITFWLRTTPSTSSVSSIVPPTFFTIRTSRRSTFEDVGVTSLVTAATAIGANVEEYCETI